MRSKEFVINRAKNYGDLKFLIEAVENAEEWVLIDPEARQLVADAMRGKKPRKRANWRDFEKSRMIAEAYYYKRNVEDIALWSQGNKKKDDACDMVAKRRAETRDEYPVSASTVRDAIHNATDDHIRWAIEFHADEWPHDIPDEEIRFVKTLPPV